MRGRIKIGTLISQDFAVMRWPTCKAPRGSLSKWQADDPNMVFEMEWTGDRFKCIAPGYGELKGHYGNGAIYVK